MRGSRGHGAPDVNKTSLEKKGYQKSAFRKSTSTALANKAAMRRLVRRVLASGCLMLVITMSLAFGTIFVFHPTGYVLFTTILYPIIMANSLLLIDSFVPATGASVGPLRDTARAFSGTLRALRNICVGRHAKVATQPGIKCLRLLVGEGSSINDSGSRRWSLVAVHPGAVSNRLLTSVQSSRLFSAVVPGPEAIGRLPWASRPASQREGVSYSFLLAVLEAWQIPDDMTAYELCEQHVKPACRESNCGFLDMLLKTTCPEDWLGPMNVFVSHW